MPWPKFTAQELSMLSPEERAYVQKGEQELIQGNAMQLDDIESNCDDCAQFAKTYRVLRRDKRQTLEKLRADLNNQTPGASEPYRLLMLQLYDRVISYKLESMARFFQFKWNDDIETWAGKENGILDRGGCLLLIVAAATLVGLGLLIA